MPPRYRTFQEYLKAEYQGPFCATDILIRYHDGKKEGLVLIQRKNQPLGLALPGGIAERITLAENAVKEAKEETGLDVVLDDIHRPLCVFSEVDQDPRAHIVSVAYTGVGKGVIKPHQEEDAKWAGVFTLEEIAQLLTQEKVWAFPKHHRQILGKYLQESGYYEKMKK
jgi:8-oxo-dGTP diphosphatase